MAGDSQEHFWGCELRKDKPEITWSYEDDEEEEDTEYVIHTLFLKHAVLGHTAVKGERNIVEIETKNSDKATVKQTLLSLTLGQQDMFMFDISFSQGSPVTFRLIEGTGPVCLAGQQLLEYPDDINESQNDSMLTEDLEEDEENISKDESFKKMSTKRKAPTQISGKKGKRDSSQDEEEEEDDDDDEDVASEEMDEDEDDDDEKSDKKKSKAKKKKEGDTPQAGKKMKLAKASPKRAAKAAKSKKTIKK